MKADEILSVVEDPEDAEEEVLQAVLICQGLCDD